METQRLKQYRERKRRGNAHILNRRRPRRVEVKNNDSETESEEEEEEEGVFEIPQEETPLEEDLVLVASPIKRKAEDLERSVVESSPREKIRLSETIHALTSDRNRQQQQQTSITESTILHPLMSRKDLDTPLTS